MSTTITAGNATNNGASISSDTAGTLQIQTGSTPTTAITVDASQNVATSQNIGVGTTPSAWGTSKAVQLGQGALWNYNGAANAYVAANYYFDGSVRRYIGTGQATEYLCNGDGTHRWYNAISGTAGGVVSFAERMQIDANGKVLIGSQSNPINGKLYLDYDGAAVNGFIVNNSTNAGAPAAFTGATGGVIKSVILNNGNMQNVNNSYGTYSDIKLKENITDATPKLDKVMQLQVRNFNLIGDELKQIGFVAQEIEQVFPSLVDELADKDEEGKELETTTKAVKTSVLIPILVKAIQELKAELDATKAEVAALKAAA